jgi:hypothetical protein
LVTVALLAIAGTARAGQVSGYNLPVGQFLIDTCGGISSGGSSGVVSPGTLLPMNQSVSSDNHEPLSTCNGVMNATPAQANWRFDDVDVSTLAPIGKQAADASGSASIGQMRLRAQVWVDTAGQTGSYGPFFGGATAGWSDHLTITATDPANDGKAGRMFFHLLVDGTLDAFDGFPSEAGVRVQHWLFGGPSGNPYTDDYLELASGLDVTAHKTVNTELLIGVNFTFGTPFDLGVFATAYAMALQGQTYANEHCESNFSNGLVWNGIASVIRSSDSQPVGYTVTATSGLDYTQSVPLTVPEPEAEALGACALCSVGFVARRRRNERLRVTG